MKVLVYTKTFLPLLGGLERNTYTLCKALTEFGHEVTLYTETIDTDDTIYNFRVIRSTDKNKLEKIIKTTDLIFINGGIALKVCIPALLNNKKYIPIYQSSGLYYREGKGFLNKINNSVRKFIANRAPVNVSVSEYGYDLLKKFQNTNPCLLLNPIDDELQTDGLKTSGDISLKNKSVLFAGRVINGKGIFVLSDAIDHFRRKYKRDIILQVAGDGEDMEIWKKTCEEKNIETIFHGKINKEELVKAYKNTRALIVPSTTHIEGNPLVIAEAISSGTPVVVSDQPAMTGTIDHAGLVFPSGDVHALSECLHQLFDDTVYDSLVNNTQKIKHKFSLENYLNSLKSILSEVEMNADKF